RSRPLPGGVAPPNTPTIAETGMPPDAYNPFNPFEQIISGATNARLADFGDRLIDNENIAELFTVGVKGDKLFNGTWGYDGAFRYSQIENTSEFRNVSVSRFNRILNAADSIFNPTKPDFIGTTIPYNPFGDFRVPIATNQPLIDFAIIHTRDLNTSKLATLDLNIYNNDTNSLVPKVGVRWQPFDEQLTPRSTWGEGFVEPSLTELYGPRIFGFGPTSFMGDRNPETAILTNPNPRLGPERSRNWTGGIV